MTKQEELIEFVIDNEFITKPSLQDKFVKLLEASIKESVDSIKYSKDNVKEILTRYEKHCMGLNYVEAKHIVDIDINDFVDSNF